MRPSPGLVLALMIAVAATQVVRLVAPDRGPYPVVLAISAAGIVGGELLAGIGRFSGPSVGVVHPVLDLVVVAVAQTVWVLVSPGPRQGPR